MRKLTFLVLLCQYALALDNSVTITNWTGSGSGAARGSNSTVQTGRPFTIHRVFAEGEITGYPKPRVNGTVPGIWQSDVKSRWRDNAAARTCSTATEHVSGQVQMTCNNHGFQNLEAVIVAGIEGLNGSYTVAEPTTNSFILKGKIYAGPYTLSNAAATGPDYGSVKTAYVSFRADVPAGGSITVDFVGSINPCSSGEQAACNAAALDQTGMLNFRGGTWNFKAEATAASVSKGVDARTMLSTGEWTYWLRGPVVTEVIVQNLTSASTWNFGWQLSGGTMIDNAGAQYQSLAPRYVLAFYSGWNGVKGQVILENSWRGRGQDQVYDLEVKVDGASAYTKTALRHYSRTRWRKVFWSGLEPGEMKVDYNFKYLVYSRALMPYDISLTLSDSSITTWLNSYLSSDRGEIMGNAIITKNMFEGLEEAGVLQGFDVGYAATGDPRLHDVLFGTQLRDTAGEFVTGGGGTASVPSHVPVYLRDTTSSTNYCRYTCVAGAAHQTYGRFMSIEANTTWRTINADPDTGVGDRAATGWVVHTSHMWNNSYVPWLATGDYYYIEDLIAWAGWVAAMPNTNNGDYNRHGYWGYHNPYGMELRGAAWGISLIAHAAFATPDAWPEKEYLTRLIETQFAVDEAQLGITDGWFGPGYPCTTSGYAPSVDISTWVLSGYNNNNNDWCNRWFWGLRTVWGTDAGSSTQMKRNFLKQWERGSGNLCAPNEGLNSTYCYAVSAMYMLHYKYAAVARVKRFGFVAANHVLREAAKYYINIVRHPSANPWHLTNYRSPARIQANPRVAVTGITPGTTTSITAPGHDLQVGDKVAICCGSGSWANLDQPWSLSNAGATVATVSGDTFTINRNSSTWGPVTGIFFITKAADGWVPQLFSQVRVSYKNPDQSAAGGSVSDIASGYPHYALNAGALMAVYSDNSIIEGVAAARTGVAAYDWLLGNITFQNLRSNNLKWSFAPDALEHVAVKAGDMQAILRWTASSAGPSRVGISATPFADSSNALDSVVDSNGRTHVFAATGLAASTTYYYRITHGVARHVGTFTTAAVGGAVASYTWTLKPPLGTSTAEIVYGLTPALGSTLSAPCASGCSVTANDAQSGRLLYYRVRYRDAAGAYLTTDDGTPAAVLAP